MKKIFHTFVVLFFLFDESVSGTVFKGIHCDGKFLMCGLYFPNSHDIDSLK